MNREQWSTLTEEQKTKLCSEQLFKEDFIHDVWFTLSEAQQDIMCEHQLHARKLFELVWFTLSETQKNILCKNMCMSTDFFQSIWKCLTENQKLFVIQFSRLRDSFIQSIWGDLSPFLRNNICGYQFFESTYPFWVELTEEQKKFMLEKMREDEECPTNPKDTGNPVKPTSGSQGGRSLKVIRRPR